MHIARGDADGGLNSHKRYEVWRNVVPAASHINSKHHDDLVTLVIIVPAGCGHPEITTHHQMRQALRSTGYEKLHRNLGIRPAYGHLSPEPCPSASWRCYHFLMLWDRTDPCALMRFLKKPSNVSFADNWCSNGRRAVSYPGAVASRPTKRPRGISSGISAARTECWKPKRQFSSRFVGFFGCPIDN